eukprot:Nk52_evm2s2103 gene=Nk52_evmTU2s2103
MSMILVSLFCACHLTLFIATGAAPVTAPAETPTSMAATTINVPANYPILNGLHPEFYQLASIGKSKGLSLVNSTLGEDFEDASSVSSSAKTATGMWMCFNNFAVTLNILIVYFSDGSSAGNVHGDSSSDYSVSDLEALCETGFYGKYSASWDAGTTFESVKFSQGIMATKEGDTKGYVPLGMTLVDTEGNSYSIGITDPKEQLTTSGKKLFLSFDGFEENLYGSPLYGVDVEMYYQEKSVPLIARIGLWTAAGLSGISFTDVSFDTDSAELNFNEVVAYTPFNSSNCAGNETINSDVSYQQSQTSTNSYTSSYTMTNSETTSHEVTVTFDQSLSIEKVLKVGDSTSATFSHSTSDSQSYAYGESNSKSYATSVSVEEEIPVPPGQQEGVQITEYKGTAKVPYTATVTYKYNNSTIVTKKVQSVYTMTGSYYLHAVVLPPTPCY